MSLKIVEQMDDNATNISVIQKEGYLKKPFDSIISEIKIVS